MTPQPTIIYAVVGLLGFFAAARAQEVTLVAPPGFVDTEGNAVANPTLPYPNLNPDDPPDGFRSQTLYPTEYFSSVGPGPFVITHWAGRPDVSVDGPVSAEYEYTVNLTTTEIDSLTSSFVGNYGSSGIATTVFSGTVSEETDGAPTPGGLPHDFDYVIEFETPYVYDPSEGNLLFEQISPTNYTTRPIWRDFHEVGSGPNLFAFNDNPASPFAQVTAQVIQIAQFTFVPEPSTLDFNNDSHVELLDVDAIVGEIVAGTNGQLFDLTGEDIVDKSDLAAWLSAAATHNGFSEAYLPGDSNLNGAVDAADLNALALNWRKYEDVARWSAGDFEPSGIVDAADLNKLALHWQQSIAMASTASAPVPEPSALLLTLVGLASVRGRARRRCVRERQNGRQVIRHSFTPRRGELQ